MSLGDLLALMHGADEAWHTVVGVAREWRDQRLVHKAFMAEAAALGGSTFTVGRGSAPEISSSECRLWADRTRVRVEREPSHEARPELLVRVGPTWWSYRSDKGAVTNAGRDNQGTGGDEVMSQLRPARYLSLFHWSHEGETEIAGRRALVARAALREPADRRASIAVPPPFDMISGGQHFEVAVDAEFGVLLRVVKLVDQEPAELHEFREITFDTTVDDSLFDFVAPDGSAVQDFDSYMARLQGPRGRRMRRRAMRRRRRGAAWLRGRLG